MVVLCRQACAPSATHSLQSNFSIQVIFLVRLRTSSSPPRLHNRIDRHGLPFEKSRSSLVRWLLEKAACPFLQGLFYPARREKFPVPVFREIVSYPLIYMWKSRNWAHFRRQNWQTSLYFPADQGMGVRDGFADDCPHRQLVPCF